MKKLTLLILMVLFVSKNFPQNITNTLPAGGSFIVKDTSTIFLSLSQADGQLNLFKDMRLENTTSSNLGVIYKGTQPFLHNYKASGTTGDNTFIGINSGNFTMSGTNNQASCNVGIGQETLTSLISGYYNSALGFRSMYHNTTGYDNSAFGSFSLFSNSGGSENSAFGYLSLSSNQFGINNAAFGANCLANNTNGYSNSAFGSSALNSNDGSENSAFGTQSLYSNTGGGYNSAFGVFSAYSNSSGNNNTAAGHYSLYLNVTGNSNTAVGESSLYHNLASGNTAIGDSSLYFNTTGDQLTAIGSFSMLKNTTGYQNTALGNYSLNQNTTGNSNTSVGVNSLYSNTGGFQNTAVGHHSLVLNTTGNYNTAVGYNAGSAITTGSNLTCIGIDANPSGSTALDEITLGNIYVQHLRCNVQTITSLSDARDKRNTRDLPLGLDFLMTLKPRLYNWDRREWYKNGKPDGSKMQETPTAGFIAQELDTAEINAKAEYLNLVLKTNPDRLEATYGNLLPVIVKALQEVNIKCDELKTENKKLKETIMTLQKKLNDFDKNENVMQVLNNN
jgi:hypothetical protein